MSDVTALSDVTASEIEYSASARGAPNVTRRIGIIGAGQLAMYLSQAAQRLGLETTVLAFHPDSPATRTADRAIEGALDDIGLIDELVSDCDVVTFDIEDIPPATLVHLASRAGGGEVAVHPDPEALLMLQDKLLQKRWLQANGLPVAPFRAWEGDVDAANPADFFGYPFVQKLRRGGYDGRGVQVIRGEHELGQLWHEPSTIEAFHPDIRELAVVAARDRLGNTVCYPLAELVFDPERNVLDTLVSPAPVPERVAKVAEGVARRALGQLDCAGVFALELFLLPDQTLLINEISPRVHNSGHHTIESCETSQYEQHIRAIGGLPVGIPLQHSCSVMRNILWSDVLQAWGRQGSMRQTCEDGDTFVHWYGKRETRDGRKMGHITAIAPHIMLARAKADRALEELPAGPSP